MSKQRLVVCLDGTWNNKDDSTNVVQHFALAVNGPAPDADGTVIQNKHYIEGVGTGVLDGITGGGFGFGLEENVRKAYDWLVANFHDDGPDGADEIYVFGFSRGAYTARSLVGFIGTCGLVKRGAPLSVNQLWKDYCILGRERENRTSFWDRVFEETPAAVRRINDLICDPWNIRRYEEHRALAAAASGGAANTERIPGQLVDDLSVTERLLVRWSRRVRITYLGIYDTVGALGLDALAIPGLKSRLAMHHNMRASTLVQHCRHALALDEHRSSFSHTPLVQYLWHGNTDDDRQSATFKAIEESEVEASPDAAKYWRRQTAMWQRKIEQRWFVGAHSNVGGGYPDNELAQRPLQWLLEGGALAGLACEPFTYVAPVKPPVPVDSYADFAKPLWTYVIRGKRFYRPIDPDPEIRASRPKPGEGRPAGFSLRSINEQVDDTVFDRARAVGEYRPPNLVEYAQRRRETAAPDVRRAQLNNLCLTPPAHIWLGATAMPYAVLVLWASCAALGVLAMTQLFVPMPGLGAWEMGIIASALALLFSLVDYCESRTNFALALGGVNPRRRAFLDAVYWTRTIGVLLFVAGAVSAIATLWTIGWNAQGASLEQPWPWLPAPLLAGVGAVLATTFDRAAGSRHKAALIGSIAAVALAILAVPAIVLFAWMVQHIVSPTLGHRLIPGISPAPNARVAGLLLILQVGLLYLAIAFRWVDEPMVTANLGSIVPLQRARTPAQVTAVLEGWRQLLANHWSGDDDEAAGPAGRALGRAVRQALWRDIFGLIPVYALVLSFGTWYTAGVFGLPSVTDSFARIGQDADWRTLLTLAGAALPILATIADYIEDACHLQYLARYEEQRPIAGWLTFISFVASTFKNTAFAIASAASAAALFLGSYQLARLGDSTGWRGSVALLISLLAGGLITVTLTAIGWQRVKTLRRGERTH